MNEYALVSDMRDLVRTCFAANCQYQMVVTRGNPSYECNLIAFWTGDNEISSIGDCKGLGCEQDFSMKLYVRLIRVCAAPQAQVNMDWAAEENEARCFYADLDRLQCCMRDLNDVRQLSRMYGVDSIDLVSVRKDPTSRGGAFSALLTFDVDGLICCDEVS